MIAEAIGIIQGRDSGKLPMTPLSPFPPMPSCLYQFSEEDNGRTQENLTTYDRNSSSSLIALGLLSRSLAVLEQQRMRGETKQGHTITVRATEKAEGE